jgi:hypothetical protein
MKLNLYFKRYKKDTKGINPSNNPYVFENMFRGNPYIKEVSLHKETIYIEEKAFKNCVSLEKINIPPKVQYLTSKMFYGCVSLREIIVENPIPLTFYPEHFCGMADGESDNDIELLFCVRIKRLFTKKSRCFERVDKKKCIIYVPEGSVELYKEAKEWKEFENIVEL